MTKAQLGLALAQTSGISSVVKHNYGSKNRERPSWIFGIKADHTSKPDLYPMQH